MESNGEQTVQEGLARLRWSMERLCDEALDRAGVELDPRAYLVAVPEDPALPVRTEPGDAPFDSGVLEELRARPADVAAVLARACTSDDRTVVSGSTQQVGDLQVTPVLAPVRDAWEQLPRLTRDTVDGSVVDRSLADAVVHDVLRAASRELDRSRPGAIVRDDALATLRAAVDHLVNGALGRTGQAYARGCRDAFEAVSAQTYEGRAGVGTIVLARRDHPAVHAEIIFDQPVPVAVPTSLRKTLEMGGPGLALLCDGRDVYGLGHIAPESYDAASEECFEVRIVGAGSWELWHASTPYLRVDNGHPALPRELVDPEIFADTVARVFADSPEADAEALWTLAEACARQSHGTILVVHPDAAAEGQRLLPQAHTVRPTRLSPTALGTLTGIDGAVLVSPDGSCHAVGVILDGVATGHGDPARGARYNSAVRYLAGSGRGAMVIIVSEDGRIDLLPALMRRVRRRSVQQAVDRLVGAAVDGATYERLERLDSTVERYEFYLDGPQCAAVNAAREHVEQRRWEEQRVRQPVVPVRPHPAMDDSYFVGQH